MNAIDITEIHIEPYNDSNGTIKAFAKIVFNGCFVIRSIKIVEGKFGLFIVFPKVHGEDVCFPITRAYFDHISKVILDKYKEDLSK